MHKNINKDVVEQKNGYKIIGKSNEYMRPWFCTAEDPDTGEKCRRKMGMWDDMWYDKYGMCEECVKKYNPHLVDALETEAAIKDESVKKD